MISKLMNTCCSCFHKVPRQEVDNEGKEHNHQEELHLFGAVTPPNSPAVESKTSSNNNKIDTPNFTVSPLNLEEDDSKTEIEAEEVVKPESPKKLDPNKTTLRRSTTA